ncbi:hypothetical protein BGZ76_002748 [Entomortierella beljakovae]|nr:hypothetical protein BGZ76_002748 [Entomortierella beljakovae]
MPSSTFLNQDFFVGVLAVYAASVAFNRWFPEADLIAVEAHPSSYVPTFASSTSSQLGFYAAYLAVDLIRIVTLAIMESTAFSFAFVGDIFEPFSYAPLIFSLVMVTKDLLLLGCLQAFPEANDIAAEKVAELMPLSVMMEQGLMAVGVLCLLKGLHRWTYAIGRDKRQVIKEDEKKNN